MVNDQLSRIVRRWVYRVRPSRAAGTQHRPTLRLEECEQRLAPATLPAPTITDTRTLTLPVNTQDSLNGYAPQAAYNPADPNKILLASTDGSGIMVSSSSDGGATWTVILSTQRTSASNDAGRMIDPSLPLNFGRPRVYTNSANPSVAFGRDGYAYVAEIQKNNAANPGGVVVLYKFKFTPGDTVATVVDLDPTNAFGPNNVGNLVHRFTGQDPALNVVVGIDNNVPVATVGGSSFSDTLAAGKANPAPIVPTTQLTQPIPSTAVTTIEVGSTVGFTPGMTILIGGELMTVNAIGTSQTVITPGINSTSAVVFNNTLTVTRGAGGTVPTTHANGDLLQVVTALPAAGINSFQTTITVANAAGFPTGNVPFNVRIDSEQLTVTAAAGNQWTVVRGVNGTAAAAHAGNATVFGVSTYAKPVVYVAWNTNATPITTDINLGGDLRNPAVILTTASEDGGLTFSTPVPVNDAPFGEGGYVVPSGSSYGAAAPRIVFSQGDGVSGNGGQLTFVWSQLSGPGRGGLVADSTLPDGGLTSGQAATTYQVTDTGGAIAGVRLVPIVATTTLIADVPDAVATTFLLATTTGLQVGQSMAIGSELVLITQIVDANTIVVTRGTENTGLAAGPYLTGTVIQVATVLTANIDNQQTTITVRNPSGFPITNLPFTIRIGTEQMSVTAVIGNTWTVTRGFNGTTAAPHFFQNIIFGVPSPVPVDSYFTLPVTIPANFGDLNNLEVSISLRTPNIGNYSVSLIAPDGQVLRLLYNRNLRGGGTQPDAANIIPLGIGTGNTLGALNTSTFTNGVSLIFSDFGPRTINDPNNLFLPNQNFNPAETSLVGTYRPDGNFYFDAASLRNLLLSNGSGLWTLVVTEEVARPTSGVFVQPVLQGWGLKFTGAITPDLGTDAPIIQTTSSGNQPIYVSLPQGIDNVNAINQDIVPGVGIGPGTAMAYDNTLFDGTTATGVSQTSHPGRLYLVYTGFALTVNQVANPDSNDTDIFLLYSDNDGLSWSGPFRVNDDVIADGTEGNRTQFQPAVSVDPLTGMVVVMWYDNRGDAGNGRAATYIATSIDGGQTWSQQTYLNTPKVATDSITGQTVVLEPIPTNLQHSNDANGGSSYVDPQLPQGVGTRQTVLAYGGRINTFWTGTYSSDATGNLNPFVSPSTLPYLGSSNATGASVYTATVRTAGGPRVDGSDQGSITTIGQFLETTGTNVPVPRLDSVGNLVSFITYNDRFATNTTTDANGNAVAPGTRLLDGFIVRFDRSMDVNTFTGADVIVQWEKAGLTNGVAPAAIDLASLGVRYRVHVVPATTYAPNSVFFVQFVDAVTGLPRPQGGVGTYSYSIGPNIQDTVLNPLTGASGSFMDQNGDGVAGIVQPGDVYAVPTPVNGGAFTRPYLTDTRPLIIPGPYVVSQSVAGQTAEIASVGIDTTQVSSLFLTVSQPTLASAFQIFSITYPDGTVAFFGGVAASFFAVPVDANGNTLAATTPTRFFRIFPGAPVGSNFLPLGNYQIVLTGNPVGQPTPVVSSVRLDTTLSTALMVAFDRSVAAADFTANDILTLNGPNGAVITTTTLPTGISSSVVTFSVASAAGFPTTGNFRIQIDGEVMTVLAVNGNSITVSRGAGATTHAAGATVRLLPTIIPVTQDGLLTASPTKYFRVIPVLATGAFLPSGAYSGTADPTTPSADGLYLNAGAQSLDVTFDRDMNVASVTRFMQVQLYGSTGPVTGQFVVTQTGISTRTFTITFPSRQVLNTAYSLVLAPVIGSDGQPLGPLSSVLDALDTNLNAGLDRLRGTGATGAAIVSDSYSRTFASSQAAATPTVPFIAIPAGQSVDVPITIGDNFVVSQDLARFPNQTIRVGFDITHPTTQDLQIVLVAPATNIDPNTGKPAEVLLYRSFQSNTGGTTANFTQTFLDDKAASPISLASAPYQGTFNPQLPLSVLANLFGSGVGVQAMGQWTLRITNTGSNAGRVNAFSLLLPHQDTTNQTGLGEPIADRATIGLRVFFQDPTTVESQNQWTSVNTATNNGATAGQATATAVDPSDRSGNTVFVSGAGGGVWKTTNFLTTDPKGPNWVPLTDGGPTYSLNVNSLALIGRNNDSNQTIVFALTGEGNVGSQGVGLLRSMNGGQTWSVLDSTNNADSLGNILPITTRGTGPFQRDGLFYGATGFKVVTDPTPVSPGNYVVWMAVQGSAAQAGLWRSLDTGRTWTRVRAGQASDVVYAPGSADPTTGLLQRLYVAFEGQGTFYTFNAPGRGDFTFMAGGDGNNLITDFNYGPPPIVTVDPPADTPNGAKGRIVLAVPGLQNSPLLNSFYQDWVYALVSNTNGTMDGLYMTKDFGRNWVKLQLPAVNLSTTAAPAYAVYPTNNETRPDTDLFSPPKSNTGVVSGIPAPTSPSFYTINEYAMGLAVDPTNPNVVYAAGIGSVGALDVNGSIRIDVSAVNDSKAFVFHDNSRAGEGDLTENSGFQATNPPPKNLGATVGRPFPGNGNQNPHGYLYIPGGLTIYTNPDGRTSDFTNLSRDPLNPFVSNASLRVGDTLTFSNDGENVRYVGFNEILNPAANSSTFGANFVKSIITFVDPLTGKTRLIYSTENGVFSGVDRGDGTLIQAVGFDPAVNNNRNGNLQLQQFTSGAVQPSQLAADLAGTMFFATGRDNGFAASSNNVLQTGNTEWTGQRGSGVGAAIDPAGSGTAYQYRQACCGNENTVSATTGDFFRVLISGSDQAFGGGVGRTNGLVTVNDNPGAGIGQWPNFDYTPDYSSQPGGQFSNIPVGYFAVNPVRADTNPDGNGGIVIGSSAGRVYLTTTLGKTWFPIAQASDLDGSLPRSLAFGSPDPNATQGGLDLFIYAGMQSGRLYLTRTGGGTGGWTQINIPLDGTPIMKGRRQPAPRHPGRLRHHPAERLLRHRKPRPGDRGV